MNDESGELPKVFLSHWDRIERETVATALAWCGRLESLRPGARVLIKPNFTFPFHRPGVTTAPDMLRAVTELLLERGAEVTICESGPSLDAFSMWGSFEEHGVLQLREEYGIRVLDLRRESYEHRSFGPKSELRPVPVPAVLHETDVFISMPVVKVHCNTIVTLALKNQWGLIPCCKRFLFHYAFDEIVVGINSLLPMEVVIADGRTVLDENGPMFGRPKPGHFLAVSNSAGAFDVAVAHLMGFDPEKIQHIRSAMESGLAPAALSQIEMNADPIDFRPFRFQLKRNLQNYASLAGFKSYWFSRLGWDSVVGELVHKLLYATKGNPLREAMEERAAQRRSAG
ncbi:MAG: DUF362 domain-containing protein [Gemmatimonadota bacterium]